MLTSSRSRPPASKSRRSRGSSRRGMRRIEEAHRGQRAAPHARAAPRCRRGWPARSAARSRRRAPPARHAHLVRGHLHRRGEVERRDSPGLAGMVAAIAHCASSSFDRPDISVPNTNATSPLAVAAGLARGVAHRQHAAGELARPCRETDRQRAAGERVGERRTTSASSSTRVAPDAQAVASGCGKVLRRDQHQARECPS